MAKRYGVLVGTPLQTIPVVQVDKTFIRTNQEIIVRDTIALAAAAINDTVQASVLGWESVLDPFECLVNFANLGATTTMSFGDVTFPAALDAAIVTSAASLPVGVQLLSAVPIANYWQPLWSLLGYATLAAAQKVGLQCELLFRTNVAPMTGQVTWRLCGERRI